MVVRFRLTEAELVPPLKETVLDVKAQLAPVGRGLQLRLTLPRNCPCGDKDTAYAAGKRSRHGPLRGANVDGISARDE